MLGEGELGFLQEQHLEWGSRGKRKGVASGCLCLCEGDIGVSGSVPYDSTAESAPSRAACSCSHSDHIL